MLLRAVLGDLVIAGMEVTVFDPDVDRDGRLAARLVELLADALAQPGRHGS